MFHVIAAKPVIILLPIKITVFRLEKLKTEITWSN